MDANDRNYQMGLTFEEEIARSLLFDAEITGAYMEVRIMDTYRVMIIGDNILEGDIELREAEANVFKKILGCLKPDGPYTPIILFDNISAIERRQKQEEEEDRRIREQAEKERREVFAEECSHLGKYSCKDVFAKAMSLFED